MEKIWLNHYPPGIPKTLDSNRPTTLVEMLLKSFAKNSDKPAYRFMGNDLSFKDIDQLSQAFAAWLQSKGLIKGDRVAVMMPNIPQYPVVVAAILRVGMVIVNVNPLYTPRELEHQLKDSGAKAIVILDQFANTLERCIEHTSIKHVVLASIGDLLPFPKNLVVNFVVTNLKRMIPEFYIKSKITFKAAIQEGKKETFRQPHVEPEDLAVLQKLQTEFTTELTTLRGRVDVLEARTATLEAQQFSTTTKLNAQVITAISDTFGNGVGGNRDRSKFYFADRGKSMFQFNRGTFAAQACRMLISNRILANGAWPPIHCKPAIASGHTY